MLMSVYLNGFKSAVAPQSGCILFEISIKRNEMSVLAYVWCNLYEFLLWRFGDDKKALLYGVCGSVCVGVVCYLALHSLSLSMVLLHWILSGKCIQTTCAQRSPHTTIYSPLADALARSIEDCIWSNEIKYPREIKSECHFWRDIFTASFANFKRERN